MLARDENSSIPMDAAPRSGTASDFSISDVRWVLRRGWIYPVLGALLGLAAGSVFLTYVPEVYKSSARMLLDRSVNRYLQSTKISDEPTFDDTDISSQIYVLSSDSIIVPVIQSLGLARDPEFVGISNGKSEWGIKRLIEKAKSTVLSLGPKLGLPEIATATGESSGLSKIDPAVMAERRAVETFLKQLTVYREDVPNVINVTFASQDPVKAAAITNAVADRYLQTIEDRKLNSSKMIAQLLQDRLLELKRQTDDADRALQSFATAHNLIGIGVTPENVSSVNGETLQTASPPNNDLIMKLKSQLVELTGKKKELERQLGPAHYAVVKLRNQMDQLTDAIKNEDQRNGLSDEDQAKLHSLESSASTFHNLYSAALRKFTEISQVQPETEDVHIITRATPPLYKNQKKTVAILGGGLMLGLLSGMGLALGREWLAGVFRTPTQVRNATGLYCTILPTVEPAAPGAGIEEYIIDAPYTRFTETLRNVRALLRADARAHGTKVVGVVSSASDEGKTTVVANLAALLNSATPSRTLVIDCDLHRRSVSAVLAPDAKNGLLEALSDPSNVATYIHKLERSGVDVLPCVMSGRDPNAAELLGSTQMKELLNVARESYDFVVVEIPPIMSMVDVKAMERFVDAFVFVIEWGKTKRSLVEDALVEADVIRDRILCAILNKADSKALLSIEAYRGRRFGDYYLG